MSTATTIYPTVAIKDPNIKGGKLIIAQKDFNSKEHDLFDAEAPTEKTETSNPLDFSKLKTIPEMKNFAVTNHIDLGDAKSKSDILAKLEAWKEATGAGNE